MAEQKLELIRLVRANRLLYDVSDHQHSNRHKVEKTWQSIADKIGVKHSREAQKKWRYLKDSWRVQRKKLDMNGGSGASLIRWPYFDEMCFMDKHIGRAWSARNSSPSIERHYSISMEEESERFAEEGMKIEAVSYSSSSSPSSLLPQSSTSPPPQILNLECSNYNGTTGNSDCQLASNCIMVDVAKEASNSIQDAIVSLKRQEEILPPEIQRYCDYLACRMTKLPLKKFRTLQFTIDKWLHENQDN